MCFLKVSGCASAAKLKATPLRLNVLVAAPPARHSHVSHHVISQRTKAITHPTFNVGHHQLAAVDL